MMVTSDEFGDESGNHAVSSEPTLWVHLKSGLRQVQIPLNQLVEESRDEVIRLLRKCNLAVDSRTEFSCGWAIEAVVNDPLRPHVFDLVLTLWSKWFEPTENRRFPRFLEVEEIDDCLLVSFEKEVLLNQDTYCCEIESESSGTATNLSTLQAHVAEVVHDLLRVVPQVSGRPVNVSFETEFIEGLYLGSDPEIRVNLRDELLYWVPEFRLYRSRRRVINSEDGQVSTGWKWNKRIWPGQEESESRSDIDGVA